MLSRSDFRTEREWLSAMHKQNGVLRARLDDDNILPMERKELMAQLVQLRMQIDAHQKSRIEEMKAQEQRYWDDYLDKKQHSYHRFYKRDLHDTRVIKYC